MRSLFLIALLLSCRRSEAISSDQPVPAATATAASSSPDVDVDDAELIVVVLPKGGRILCDGEVLADDATLEAKIAARAKTAPKLAGQIVHDPAMPSERIEQVAAMFARHGVKKVGRSLIQKAP